MKEQTAIKWEDQIIDILTNGRCDKKNKNYDPDALDDLMFAARELACNHYELELPVTLGNILRAIEGRRNVELIKYLEKV